MAITNLTGCTWVANPSLSITEAKTYNITFTNNGTTYSQLRYSSDGQGLHLFYDSTEAYGYFNGSTSWRADSYKTIEITGGADVTNAALIAWLEANGTLTRGSDEPTVENKIFVGGLNIAKMFVGNTEVNSVSIGDITIYTKK